jgi:hypothetical protein
LQQNDASSYVLRIYFVCKSNLSPVRERITVLYRYMTAALYDVYIVKISDVLARQKLF